MRKYLASIALACILACAANGVRAQSVVAPYVFANQGGTVQASELDADIQAALNPGSAAITAGLGFTPLNKAGDTMSGPLTAPGLNLTGPITLNAPLTAPSAGDGEVGYYVPQDPLSTNYVLESNTLNAGWSATNVTVAASALPGAGTGPAWDLTTTAVGGYLQQIVSLPASAGTQMFWMSAYFDSTRSGTPWTIAFFFTGGGSYSMTYNPATKVITCTPGAACKVSVIGNKVRMQLGATNAGSTSANLKLYPTGTMGAAGLSTADDVQFEAAPTGAVAQLAGPTCINPTTTSSSARTGGCNSSAASGGLQPSGGTLNGLFASTVDPSAGTDAMIFGKTTAGAISPNNALRENNCRTLVTVCPYVIDQNNEYATVAAVQPFSENYRAHCVADLTYLIADYSGCTVQPSDALALLQAEGADGWSPTDYSLTSVMLTAPGSGYMAGDTIPLQGGTICTDAGANCGRAVVTVDSIGSGGSIATYHVSTYGGYSAAPAGTLNQYSTSGFGSGATFTATVANHANATAANIIIQADPLGIVSAFNVPGEIRLGVHANGNPAPAGMIYPFSVRTTGSIDFQCYPLSTNCTANYIVAGSGAEQPFFNFGTGLLAAGVMPLATTSARGAVAPDGTATDYLNGLGAWGPLALATSSARGAVAPDGVATHFLNGAGNFASVQAASSGVAGVVTPDGVASHVLNGSGAFANVPTWFPAPVSSNWYSAPFQVAGAGSPLTASTIYCTEEVSLVPITVKALGARITTVGTSNFQLAVYADGGGYPAGSPLSSTASIADTATGVVSGSVTAFALPVGSYWECVNANDSAVVFMSNSTTNPMGAASFGGNATLANLIGAATTAVNFSLSQSGAFGTWPALSASGWTPQHSGYNPLPFLQSN